MKRIFQLLCLMLCAGSVYAMPEGQVELQTVTRDSMVVIEKIYFDRNQVYAHPDEMRKLNKVIDMLKEDPSQHIQITGFSDHFGGDVVNDRFSLARAEAIANYLKLYKIPAENMTFSGMGIDKEQSPNDESRRVEISRLIEVVESVAPSTAETTAPAVTEEVEENTVVEQQPETTTTPAETVAPAEAKMQEPTPFTLRSNLLYFAGGLFNLGVGYRHNDWNYTIQGGYSPFSSSKWNKNLGGWFVSPEVQYFMGKNKKGYLGLQFLAGATDIKIKKTGYKGDVLMGGLTGGYKLELSKHFDLDFSLGLGYGSLKYDSYVHVEPDMREIKYSDVRRNMILPTQAGITLVWKIY